MAWTKFTTAYPSEGAVIHVYDVNTGSYTIGKFSSTVRKFDGVNVLTPRILLLDPSQITEATDWEPVASPSTFPTTTTTSTTTTTTTTV